MLLERGKSQLLVVDLQEKLFPAIHGGQAVVARAKVVIEAARVLGVPITISEHNPAGIGHTVAPILETAGDAAVTLAKMKFSCAADPAIGKRLAGFKRRGRPQVVVLGTESHVCVAQSALDLASRGYSVALVEDAVGSRNPASVETALMRMARAGIEIVNAEMVVFEWIGDSADPVFRRLLPLIR
ncbi:MAG: isochorismatase family protein [Flavobacteriaceae bacterium]